LQSQVLAAGDDYRIDPDHLTLHVEQRAAAVSRINGGVRLDQIVIGPDGSHGPG
jgi:hypothetical protein